MWADKFYTLRNHIIHGKEIEPKDFCFGQHRHHDLAVWFFILSVKKLLDKYLKEDSFYDRITVEGDLFTYKRETGESHRKLDQKLREVLKKRNLKP